jgi:small-conductance mechanosensitive channel
LIQANGVLIEELIRDTFGVILLIAFLATIYFATRRFVGEKGKTPTRGSVILAAVLAAVLVMLLIMRQAYEAYIAKLVAPLNLLVVGSEPNWPEQAAIGTLRLVIVTIAIVLIIQAMGRVYWYCDARVQRWHGGEKRLGTHLVVFLIALLRLARYLSVVVLVFLFLPFIFQFFPRTKALVDRSESYLETPARDVGAAILTYLPNLGYLAVILIVGFYWLKAVRYVFTSLETGAFTIKGFLPEWANPTYRLIRTLFLLFLLMVSYPYLPGSKSQFFQGFSVFLGAMITFGSTATIGNIVSGTVLTYTRAFRIGDMVTIGDRTGVVIEKNLLVTRLRTPNNEEVSIPNGNVLSTSVLNYSARAKEGLVLSVTAGIGYDVDWRRVHQLLIEGASATEHIMTDPAPQVFQSALGDYAVN